jgi:hypothetical protein
MPISVLNKGVVVDEDIILTSLAPDIVEVEEDRIIGRKVGEGKVRCALSKNETKYKDITILVEESHEEDNIHNNVFHSYSMREETTLHSG